MIVKELQNYQILMNRTVLNPKDRSWLEALGSFVKIVQPVRGLVGKKEKYIIKRSFLCHLDQKSI